MMASGEQDQKEFEVENQENPVNELVRSGGVVNVILQEEEM